MNCKIKTFFFFNKYASNKHRNGPNRNHLNPQFSSSIISRIPLPPAPFAAIAFEILKSATSKIFQH